MSENGEEVKVYLRFRPMDKLETSKRSKDCIELHTNPQIVTVDSHLQGPLQGVFDMVGHYVTLPANQYSVVSFPSPNVPEIAMVLGL